MNSTEIETRLAELEGRYAFLDDVVNQLDSVVARQQRSIDELQAQLRHMHERLERGQSDEVSPTDERPPHY